MNSSRKHLILNLIKKFLLIALLLFVFGKIQKQIVELEKCTVDVSKIVSYCAKEKNQENKIYFNYPQFKVTAYEKMKLMS